MCLKTACLFSVQDFIAGGSGRLLLRVGEPWRTDIEFRRNTSFLQVSVPTFLDSSFISLCNIPFPAALEHITRRTDLNEYPLNFELGEFFIFAFQGTPFYLLIEPTREFVVCS